MVCECSNYLEESKDRALPHYTPKQIFNSLRLGDINIISIKCLRMCERKCSIIELGRNI